MNIGDRVRVIRGTEEGVITQFLANQQVEIEIEDGFRIPVLKSEIVVVAQEESIWLKPNTQKNSPQETPQKIWAETGVFIAVLPTNDQNFALYFINNTDLEILCTIGEIKENYRGIKALHLQKRAFEKINEMSLAHFDKWGGLLVQILFFRTGFALLKEPLVKKLYFKPANLGKHEQKAPLLDKKAFLFQLDKEEIKSLSPEKLRENMLEKKENPTSTKPTPKVKNEIDLHVEALFGKKNIDKNNILHLQLEQFEIYLDKAIAAGLDQITVIHGVGNGILKTEIHKRLSQARQNGLIRFYQEARKEKFGYGATQVQIH